MKELTEEEYVDLRGRVVQGKKFLAGKWSSTDPMIKKWISLWFDMSSQIMDYEIRHNLFGIKEEEHSQAWKDMVAREAKDNDKKEKARERYRLKKEERNAGRQT